MNKKPFILVLILIFITLFAIYVYNDKADSFNTLPDFTFYTLDGKKFNKENILSNRSIFMYINTECKICEYELDRLQIIQDSILNYDIYLISSSNFADYNRMLKKYEIPSIPNVKILLDKNFNFPKIFKTNITPSSFIFNSKGIFEKSFQGVSDTEEFFKYMLKHNCE